MKSPALVLAGLIPLVAIAPTPLVMAQDNQPTLIRVKQNDVRPAIARINPEKPIQIRVVSRTNVPVVATIVTVTGDRPITPGKSVTFGRLHTSYLSLPLNLQVSLQETPDPNQSIRLYLDVKTSGNEIIVSVLTSSQGGGNSSQSINIDEQGLIYVY